MQYTQLKKKLLHTQMSFLICLLLIFVFMMNYPDHSIGGEGLYLPFNNLVWIGFSILLLLSVLSINYLGSVKVSIFHLLYALAIVFLLLPLIYTDTRFLKYEVMEIWAILGAYFLFVISTQFSNQSLKNKVLTILLLSSVIQSIWGLVQYYFIFEQHILFLVSDYGLPNGVFNQANTFSIYLNLGSLIALYFYFTSKRQSTCLFVLVLLLLAVNAHLNVLASTSTSRLVSLISLGIYLAYFAYKKRNFVIPGLILAISVLVSFAPRQWFDVRPVSETTIDAPVVMSESLGIRPVFYKLGAELAIKKPIQGTGIGQIRYEFAQYFAVNKDRFEDYAHAVQVLHIHNEPLQWIIELGFISGLAFVIIFTVWVWGIWRKYLDPRILFLGLPFVGQSMLEFPFHVSAPHFLVFAILLGISIKKPMHRVKVRQPAALVSIVLAAIVATFSILHMMKSLASSEALTDFRRGEVTNIAELEKVDATLLFSPIIKMEVFEYKLKKGYATGQINVDDIYEFIEWAEYIKEYYPVNKTYIRLAQAYMISQNFEASLLTLNEAELLFPYDKQVVEMVAEMREFMRNK